MYSELKTSISQLKITRLFGSENVDISFDNNVKILMGENGTGKTTILNILYYSLTLNYSKLVNLPFESVEINFTSGDSLRLVRDELDKLFIPDNDSFLFHRLFSRIQPQEFTKLVHLARNRKLSEFEKFLDEEIKFHDIPARLVYRELRTISRGKGNEVSARHQEIIDSSIKDEILYFPTYRRIEEDLINLGMSRRTNIDDELLIKFGLTDVEKLIEKLKSEIKDISIKWFSKVNGEMLSQLITGIEVTEEMRESIKIKIL